ncbi:MAG: tRNA (guanosine(46)-N7)-methyltransferase TrmB [Saprospiraceae bacterium]|nr:tRNA (guanosine(46)-N7)-methyltransferase TrmB [Saprospiraceae bacterium]
MKKKLQQFAETKTFPNFFEPSYEKLKEGFSLKGNWRADFFKNQNPIIIELGCGKGEYTVGLAEKYPDKNYIGIDLKGARMWRGCKDSIEKNMKNVAFVRSKIQNLEYFFAQDEIDEIWLTFPDPQPRSSKENKRLSSPAFINRYKNILKKDAIIHLKTDDVFLFDYTLGVIAEYKHELIFETHDLYKSGINDDVMDFQTHYEKIFLREGKKINYLKFKL